MLKIPEDDYNVEALRIYQTGDALCDPDEVSALENPMAGWVRRRCDRMRKLGEEYQDTLARLGLLDEVLLVQTKETGEGSRFEWCLDCRGQPDSTEIKVFHHNRPPDDEQSSSESENFDVSNEVMEQEINEIMEDLGLELLFLEEDPIDESQLDANGLCRRPPEDEDFDEVKILRKKPSSGLVLTEESPPLPLLRGSSILQKRSLKLYMLIS